MTDRKFLEGDNDRLRTILKQAGVNAEASELTQNLQRFMLAELHHRIKNLLTMVLSIVTQSLKSTQSTEEASEAIGSRIHALARTHDIILSTAGEGSLLSSLLGVLVAPFGASRFRINVPATDISSRAAVALALAINELGTNAVKYGALSVPEGKVEVTGRADPATHELLIEWVESGGPAVHEPSRRSFGTQLMHVVLPTAPKLEFRAAGVVCELRVPLPLNGGGF